MRIAPTRALPLLAAAWLAVAKTLLAAPEISLVVNVAKGHSREPIYNAGAFPDEVLAVANGRWVFASDRYEDGAELWVTDGTPGGTQQLSDLCLGPCIYRVQLLGSNGRRALFLLYSFSNPAVRGVWATDGSRQGTQFLRGFEVGSESFQFVGSFPDTDAQYFTLCEPACALWRTDGTRAGTRRVTTLGGESSRSVGQAAITGGRLFLTVVGSDAQLWVSDGTSAGTRALVAVRWSYSAKFAVAGRWIYFEGGDERLWVSDGTPSGTKSLHPRMSPSGAWALVGKGVCFPGYQAETGWDLWCSEGTPASTRAWTQFVYFEAVHAPEDGPFEVVAYKNRRYFMATDGLTGYTLWSTDGTPGGLKAFGGCAQCPEEYFSIALLGSKLLIDGYGDDSGHQLLLSDGTIQGTAEFRVCSDCQAWLIKVSGAHAFLVAESDSGGESSFLFRTDGTARGTVRLLRAEQCCGEFTISERSAGWWWLGGTGLGLARLFASDGTREGTVALSPRFGSAEKSSYPMALLGLGAGTFFCADPRGEDVYGPTLWFAAGPGEGTRLPDYCDLGKGAATPEFGFWTGFEQGGLRRSDGTSAGTALAVPHGTLDDILQIDALGDQVGLTVLDHDQSYSLHRSGGGPPGTTWVADLPSEPWGLSSTEGALHFFTTGNLWRSDLTSSGTQVLRHDVDDSLAGPLVRYGPLLLVRGPSRISWLRADGSTAPQALVSDASLLYNRSLFVHQHWAYFWGHSAESYLRVRLARVDLDQLAATGAAAPEILAGFDLPTEAYRGSFAGTLVALDDGRLAFTARDKKFGEELFVTDGTSSGTRRVRDVYPGPVGGVFSDPVPLGGGVVFAAHDGEHGVELWWSDGTSAGTGLIKDLRPGIGSSSPDGFLVAAGRVYFAADDGKIGRELWVVEP